jgi:hypothetical protein
VSKPSGEVVGSDRIHAVAGGPNRIHAVAGGPNRMNAVTTNQRARISTEQGAVKTGLD